MYVEIQLYINSLWISLWKNPRIISDILQHFNGAVKKGKKQLIQSTFPFKINHKLLKINIYQKKAGERLF